MSDAVEAITARSADLTAEYTEALDAFSNNLVPRTLTNAEYAARTSALMIALNRELARCAAAFGEVHGVAPDLMLQLVKSQFNRNFETAIAAMGGQSQVIQ